MEGEHEVRPCTGFLSVLDSDGYEDAGCFCRVQPEQADGSFEPYSGYVQSRMSCFNRGNVDEFFFTTELSRRYGNQTWRVGLNEWYYDIDYASNTTMCDHTVEAYPQMLYGTASNQVHYYGNAPYYNFNQNASEYYKGHENKLALYATHD